MWKDSKKARFERYLGYLKQNPGLYQPFEFYRQNVSEDKSDIADFLPEEQQETFETVNDYVLAPALDSYVLWALREAIASGKKRLYFLARDGYLMYRAAQVYCQMFQLPIQCCYLCCSRYSIRIPMFHLNMDEAMDYICRGGIDVTLKKILNRAGLTIEEQDRILYLIGMTGKENEIIPYAQIAHIRQRLEQCDLFKEFVVQRSKESMPDLSGYLLQEGLLDDVPYALVDSGWVGSMQKVLKELLDYVRGESDKPDISNITNRLEGYYWGLYELPEGVHAADYHCYYFSPDNNLKEKVYFSNCLFEGIFSAPHGMTLRYQYEDGYYRPVFAEISDSHQIFMEEIEQRVLRYVRGKADTMLKNMNQNDNVDYGYNSLEEYLVHMDVERNHRTIYSLLKLFMAEPTSQEAELFGQLQFSDDVLEESGQQIAAPLSQQELQDNHVGNKMLTMLGLKKGHVKESAWYEGSAVRSGRDVEKHLRRYAGYKYLLYLRKKRIWSKRKDG